MQRTRIRQYYRIILKIKLTCVGTRVDYFLAKKRFAIIIRVRYWNQEAKTIYQRNKKRIDWFIKEASKQRLLRIITSNISTKRKSNGSSRSEWHTQRIVMAVIISH